MASVWSWLFRIARRSAKEGVSQDFHFGTLGGNHCTPKFLRCLAFFHLFLGLRKSTQQKKTLLLLMRFSALNHYRDALLEVLESGIRLQSIKHRLCRDVGQHEGSLAIGAL